MVFFVSVYSRVPRKNLGNPLVLLVSSIFLVSQFCAPTHGATIPHPSPFFHLRFILEKSHVSMLLLMPISVNVYLSSSQLFHAMLAANAGMSTQSPKIAFSLS